MLECLGLRPGIAPNFCISADVGRQQVVAQVLTSLTPTREIQIEFLAPDIWEMNQSMEDLVHLLLCLTVKQFSLKR